VVLGLRPVSAPPALWGGLALCPIEVLPSQTVPHLDMVEPQGKSLGTTGHRTVGFLALWHAILLLRGPASRPLVCLHPLLLRNLPLEVGEQSWDRSVVACLLCHLGPLVRLLVASDSFVHWAPSDFDDDTRPSHTQRGDVLPRLGVESIVELHRLPFYEGLVAS